MGNTHAKPHPRPRNKKQVHWKAADRPSPPGKPHLSADNDLTPDLVTIVWSKPIRDGGSPVTGYLVEHRRTGSPHWVRATPLLVPFPELTISGLEPGWRYQFRVRAENAVGLSDSSEISEPLTVTLQKYAITAPKFTEELNDATVLENEKAEFAVHFLGQPAPKICWFKDGFEIFSSRRIRILTESDRSILTIHQSALTDEGEIKCTATNKAGHASTKARLTLEAQPSIRLPRQYEDGLLFEIGEVVRLKVSVAGRPTPLVFWTHNGESIKNNDRYEVEYVDKSSILKIGEARRSDRGEYQIKAVNKIGEDSTSFLVTVTDKPSPPSNARVVMTLGRSVTLSWAVPEDDGGCKIGNYIVEYYRLGWNVWLKAASTRQLTTILGDLIEGSEYKFRVKAESPYGVSDPSEESDVIFIPDARRGITTPQARSKSHPKYLDEITAPPVVKRRSKIQPRSQSSTAKAEAIINYYDEVPKRPERTKIKSPPKTPELSPKTSKREKSPLPHTIIDGLSIARELAYGSRKIEVKQVEIDPPQTSYIKSNNSRSLNAREKSPSPLLSKSSVESVQSSGKDERNPLPQKSEPLEESSEFMLVLYPDANEKSDQPRNIDFDFDDFDIPPPISLSAPELGVEPPIFGSLKFSASSTELLHERALIRFNDAAAAEEADLKRRRKFSYDGQHNMEIPKIQINSKDDQDIVGLERRHSRRKSSGGVVTQQVLWVQRRFSLRNSNDLTDLSRQNGDVKKPIVRQRSESEEREEEEFNKVRARMALQGQSSFERRSIDVVDEEKWLEDYEESLSESEPESSEDERQIDVEPPPSKYSEEEEEMYRPGTMATRKSISDEPFEILTKRNKLPDPNFVPRPILKKTEEQITEPVKEVASRKTRSPSPRPQFKHSEIIPTRERSQSLIQQTPISANKQFQRSLSISEGNKTEPISVTPKHNISKVATICGITAASVVIPEQLLKKKKDEEEAKVVADHYMDIVKNYGQKKKMETQVRLWKVTTEGAQLPLNQQTWKNADDEVENFGRTWSATIDEQKTTKKVTEETELQHETWRNVLEGKQTITYEAPPRPNPQVQGFNSESKELQIQLTQTRHDPTETIVKPRLDTNPTSSVQKRSPSPQKQSPTPQRGRTFNRGQHKTTSRSKTPSKSPTRLENWSDRPRRRSSPSPLKKTQRKTSSTSPVPYAKPRPMLREIMTQTSIGLELNYSSDSRTSSPIDRRHEELVAQAEVKVRSVVDYTTDLAMFVVACWLYLFSNELLAIPILLIMAYRQLKIEVSKRLPKWITRRFSKKKSKKQ